MSLHPIHATLDHIGVRSAPHPLLTCRFWTFDFLGGNRALIGVHDADSYAGLTLYRADGAVLDEIDTRDLNLAHALVMALRSEGLSACAALLRRAQSDGAAVFGGNQIDPGAARVTADDLIAQYQEAVPA